jgi:hypothetical protein
LYIIDSSAIYPLNNNRMIYTRGKSKIDGPADTKYRTKYELLPRHAHEGASPRVPIFSAATSEKSQYTYIALLLYYIAPLVPPPLTHAIHLHKPFSGTSPPATGSKRLQVSAAAARRGVNPIRLINDRRFILLYYTLWLYSDII